MPEKFIAAVRVLLDAADALGRRAGDGGREQRRGPEGTRDDAPVTATGTHFSSDLPLIDPLDCGGEWHC